jgi:hypothetical protein
MRLARFFLFPRKQRANEVQVAKMKAIRPPTVGEMAAGNLTAAAAAVGQLMDQQEMPTKILAVQDGITSTVLVEYALKMAHKLDCEIVALDVSAEPLQFDGDRRERESSRFYERARRSAEVLQLKAEAMGVKVHHLMQIGEQEEVIKRLSTEDRTIRYVLTKPPEELQVTDQRRARVPVFDLNCSRL